MKNLLLLLLTTTILLSCDSKQQPVPETSQNLKTYPAAITKVFNAHGGMASWDAQEQLAYTIADSKNGNQTHTVALKSRKIRHDAPNYTLGYDGDKVWLAQDSTYFNPARARFSHNLIFYFYAMPFVLGDEGITYSEAPAFTADGVTYEGTKITFKQGVGDAPDDNYILYSHPETHQMTWLAYTVTYGKGEANTRYSYIKYPEWATVEGVQLPSKLEWYAVKDGVVGEKRFERIFINASLRTTTPEDTLFTKPENGVYAE